MSATNVVCGMKGESPDDKTPIEIMTAVATTREEYDATSSLHETKHDTMYYHQAIKEPDQKEFKKAVKVS